MAKDRKVIRHKGDLFQSRAGYAFISPAFLVLVLMVVYPLIYGIVISFFDTNLVNKFDFVGLKYYGRLIKDASFYASLGRTVMFTFFTVLGRTILAVLFANILVMDNLPYKKVFRAILVLPWFFPDVVVGMIWKGFPFMMVMLLAALQTISKDLYEAAELDGCGVIQRFLHVTLPGIMPVLSTTLMLEIMWCFKHFTLIWNLTKGGPVDATRVVSIDIYRTGFDYMRFGESSTRAVFVFIIIIILTLLQKKMKRSDV